VLDATADQAEAAGLARGGRIDLRAPDGRFEALWTSTFADVREGDVLLYEDSSRRLALAVNNGNAAGLLDLEPDAEVELTTR
jgi:S-adenosylmethionine hydrolase